MTQFNAILLCDMISLTQFETFDTHKKLFKGFMCKTFIESPQIGLEIYKRLIITNAANIDDDQECNDNFTATDLATILDIIETNNELHYEQYQNVCESNDFIDLEESQYFERISPEFYTSETVNDKNIEYGFIDSKWQVLTSYSKRTKLQKEHSIMLENYLASIDFIVDTYHTLGAHNSTNILREYYQQNYDFYVTQQHKLTKLMVKHSNMTASQWMLNIMKHSPRKYRETSPVLNSTKKVLSFGEHVYDFNIAEFRRTKGEDHCTINCAITKSDVMNADTTQINDIFNIIYPDPQVCKYIKIMLCDVLAGNCSKSILVETDCIDGHQFPVQSKYSLLYELLAIALGNDYYIKMNINRVNTKQSNLTSKEHKLLKNCRALTFTELKYPDSISNSVVKNLANSLEIWCKNGLRLSPCVTPIITCDRYFKINNSESNAFCDKMIFFEFTRRFMNALTSNQRNDLSYRRHLATALIKMLLDEYKLFKESGAQLRNVQMPVELKNYKEMIKNSVDGYF